MSIYGSLDTNISKCMCNTSKDIIRYFSTVDSEDPVYLNICNHYLIKGSVYFSIIIFFDILDCFS